jgi:hypothetical protein
VYASEFISIDVTPHESVKVLLIEDDEDDYLITRNLLRGVEAPTFVLEWVKTYDAGLEALTNNQYDVCLLDYDLGGPTGLDLLREPEWGNRLPGERSCQSHPPGTRFALCGRAETDRAGDGATTRGLSRDAHA